MSGGTFSKSARPERPGVYTNFEAVIPTTINPSAGSIVAIPLVHSWGPFKEFTLLNSYSEFLSIFGSGDTAGHRAVRQAFLGEGLPGRGGAGAVLAYRFGTEAAKAAKVLKNTAGSPENAITLTAVYEGTVGNNLRVTTRDHAADNTKNELLLFNGTTLLETYVYTDANITSLGEQINANSSWVTATVTKSGTGLAVVSSQALTEGKDGDNPKKAAWTEMLESLSTQRFGLVAPYLLTDATVGDGDASDVHASLNTWISEMNATGHRSMLVVGGELDEEMLDANERSAAFNDPNVVNLGYGSYTDENLIDETTGSPRVLSTAELAPRLAGILAAKGEALSATFARFQGLKLTNGPVESDILVAFDGGTTVLSSDSNADAPVRVEKSLTSYTTDTDVTVPYPIYRNPKFVLTMQGLERELQEYAESNVIGQLPVNDKTRQLLVGEMKVRLQNRVDRSIIQPNPTVGIDPDPPPSDDDEFIGLVYGVKFGRSIEQVYNTIRVG